MYDFIFLNFNVFLQYRQQFLCADYAIRFMSYLFSVWRFFNRTKICYILFRLIVTTITATSDLRLLHNETCLIYLWFKWLNQFLFIRCKWILKQKNSNSQVFFLFFWCIVALNMNLRSCLLQINFLCFL